MKKITITMGKMCIQKKRRLQSILGTGEWTDRQILSIISSTGKKDSTHHTHSMMPNQYSHPGIFQTKKRSSSVSKILTKYVKMSTSRKKNKSLGRNSQSASQPGSHSSIGPSRRSKPTKKRSKIQLKPLKI